MTDQEKETLREDLRKHEDGLVALMDQMPGDGHWKGIAKIFLNLAFMCWKRALYDGKRVGD